MSLISTEAFVINGFNYGETSKIVTFFSFESGKFSAVVKGVRALKSRYSGVFENMNLVNLFFNKKDNRSLQVISKADCINSFKNVKKNLDKLNIGYQILEITNKTTIEYDPHQEIFFLLKDILLMLDNMKSPNDLPVLLFNVKLANYLGIEPAVLNLEEKFDGNQMVADGTFTVDKTLKLSEEEYNLLQLLRNYEFDLNENISCDVYIVDKLIKLYESYFIQGFHKSTFLKTNKIKEELKRKI
jgi:DNA repair protein RecO (recombination protein O)